VPPEKVSVPFAPLVFVVVTEVPLMMYTSVLLAVQTT